MKIDTNSNVYTLVYASGVVIIVAFLLAFVSKALEPSSLANERIDKKKQILASLNVRGIGNDQVEAKYDKYIVKDMIIRSDGSVSDEGDKKDKAGFKVDSKNIDDDNLPVYQCYVNGQTKYVIPLYGKGLWGPIWGYIALDEDKNTVYGAYFGHASETAGLGARLTEEDFQEKFIGKKIYDDRSKSIALSVVKKKDPTKSEYQCDAITGATFTSNGITAMIHDCLTKYKTFLMD